MFLHPSPAGLPGLAALALGTFAFIVAVLAARRGRAADDAAAQRFSATSGGILVQGLGIGLTGFGPMRIIRDPLAPVALLQAAAVAALLASAVALFAWSTRTMGRNWSIRARTRADHALVQDGPFRFVRNPIYAAIFLFIPAMAIAMGHYRQLLLSVPLFALGTAIRVRHEEALLRASFGAAYLTYAARVKRFVPGLF